MKDPTSPTPAVDLTSQVVVLATDQLAVRRRIEGIAERLAGLARQLDVVSELRGDIAGLAEKLEALAGTEDTSTPDAEPLLWDWAKMSRDQASECWEILTPWVRDVLGGVYGRLAAPPMSTSAEGFYGAPSQSGDLVPSCWPAHRDIVVDLSWLCQFWTYMYGDAASTAYRSASDWHDRYLPSTLARIRKGPAGRCLDAGVHQTAPAAAALDEEFLNQAVNADLSARS